MNDPNKQKHKIMLYFLVFFCMNSVASGVGPNEVIAWTDSNFQGTSQSWTLDPGYRHEGVGYLGYKPKTSSIEVGSNVNVVVFRHDSFSGPSKVFEYSVDYVGDYWNDAISSLIIFPKGQAYPLGVTISETAPNTVTGYEPTSEFFPLPEDLNETEALFRAFSRDIDENANYVIIQVDNVEAELFQGHNFEPTDVSLVLPPRTKVCSYGAEGEFNGRKFYRLSGCGLKTATSMKVRWTGAPKKRGPAVGTSAGGFISEPGGDQTIKPTGDIPQIVSVSWHPKNKAIQVIFDKFPVNLWNQKWEMHIDNNEMPVVAPEGAPNVRPNAPFEKNPTGVFIGTLPWLSDLSAVDFPCCGIIKFCIPEKGCTNEFPFNLAGDGCKTASPTNCGSGTKSPPSGSSDVNQKPTATELISDKAPSGSRMELEENTDRPGMNYKTYYTSADYHPCYNDCANDPKCKAFTYVKPGFRGPNSQPECWLKDGVPDPMSQEYCTSGIKVST